jgi:hypothetical protein
MEDEAGGFETLPYKFSLNPSLKRRENPGIIGHRNSRMTIGRSVFRPAPIWMRESMNRISGFVSRQS